MIDRIIIIILINFTPLSKDKPWIWIKWLIHSWNNQRSSLAVSQELFNIISYFDMTPAEFFAPLDDANTPYRELCEKLRTMNEEDLEKVSIFIGWIEKKE